MIRQLFARIVKGDPDATELCLLVFRWANSYDHLVDQDVTEAERESVLHDAMWALAVELPRTGSTPRIRPSCPPRWPTLSEHGGPRQSCNARGTLMLRPWPTSCVGRPLSSFSTVPASLAAGGGPMSARPGFGAR